MKISVVTAFAFGAAAQAHCIFQVSAAHLWTRQVGEVY